MEFSPSELSFIKINIILIGIAFILRCVCNYYFIKTLSKKDSKTLEDCFKNDKVIQSGEIARHTVILATTVYVTGLIIFMKSAIIVAMCLRRFL